MLRNEKTFDRFVNQIQARHDKHREVDECANDLSAAIAERAQVVGRPAANPPGDDRNDERAAIAQVVDRVGHESQAPGEYSGDYLDHRQQQIQYEREHKALVAHRIVSVQMIVRHDAGKREKIGPLGGQLSVDRRSPKGKSEIVWAASPCSAHFVFENVFNAVHVVDVRANAHKSQARGQCLGRKIIGTN